MVVVDPRASNDSAPPGLENRLILVSGPARSGKSRWAEQLLHNKPVVTYIATAAARPEDAEWQARLELHRQRRPGHWGLAESGGELVEVVESLAPGQSVLIDALGGFVAHHLELDETDWNRLGERLISSIMASQCTCVVVIEETGWGVVPPTRIGGVFRDRLGALAQKLDGVADDAWLVVQGRALDLHALGHRVP